MSTHEELQRAFAQALKHSHGLWSDGQSVTELLRDCVAIPREKYELLVDESISLSFQSGLELADEACRIISELQMANPPQYVYDRARAFLAKYGRG